MKVCSKCKGDPQPDSAFNRRGSGLHSYCRPCQKEYDKSRYKERQPQEIERARVKRTTSYAAKQKLLRTLKDNPCLDCGDKFHFSAMDFDHRDPDTKLADVGQLVGQGCSIQTFLDEVAKCDLVCANCHRVRTYNKQQRFSRCVA